VLVLDARPDSAVDWLRDVWRHREVLSMLARADFHVRYKRASFGVAWAVAVPVLQATVLTVVFSKLIHASTGTGFGAYVLSGVLAWSYFSQTVGSAATSIVDGSGLTDKVWFPRALLVFVPTFANIIGFFVSVAVLVVALPVLGSDISVRLAWLVPACALLFAFTASLGLVLAALHVYFRDVRFLVQAAMMVWFYVTPIAYPRALLGRLAVAVDFNPLTGIVTMFHMASVPHTEAWHRSVAVSVVVTLVLAVIGIEAQRRHDRLFVDLL